MILLTGLFVCRNSTERRLWSRQEAVIMNSMGVCKMDNGKVGELIRRLRKEKNMTQLQLAEQLHVSDKAVSKWERGMGSPELSLMAELSRIFAVDMENLLAGELKRNELMGGNMRKLQFYVCPDCGNLLTSMTDTDISCCGRKLKAITPVKAAEEEKLSVERIEQDLFISSDHEMSREHYITCLRWREENCSGTAINMDCFIRWCNDEERANFYSH